MEQGNEGDNIILLAFRQIGCQIPDDINAMGPLSTDLIVEIFSRSVWLISDNET